MRQRSPAIVSPSVDFGWFVAPGLVCAAWAVVLGLATDAASTGLGLWIVGVVLVDVAHVYASLWRTYLDAEARRLHRRALIVTPLACAWVAFLLHLESARLFWGALAYLAVFHFIKQHVGFALIYVRAARESRLDRMSTTAAVWAGTLAPIVYWHAHLPTVIAWFVPGEFVAGLPGWAGAGALWAEVPIWMWFFVRRLQLRSAGRPNPMVAWLAVVPAVNWHLGIVIFDDDRIFTITNVFLHGVPYLALVWIAGGRDRARASLGAVARGWATIAAVFYGLLVVLAVTEEALWDRLVWHDHPGLFGGGGSLALHEVAMAAVVALLTVPQATHYVLDRFIWRVGPTNPRLATQLGLDRT